MRANSDPGDLASVSYIFASLEVSIKAAEHLNTNIFALKSRKLNNFVLENRNTLKYRNLLNYRNPLNYKIPTCAKTLRKRR